jgi:SAM-dependent methyltransferase
VYCVVCEKSFKRFSPFGRGKRRTAQCPYCDSLERHRLFWKYLNEKTNFKNWNNISLLHFAPERIFYERFAAIRNINYVPCDLLPERYKFKNGPATQKIDITSIPFQDNSFDVIICSHVLEHVPDDHLAMTELRRVMKPDGWGIFQVPIDYNRKETYEDFSITSAEGRLKAFGQSDHVRWYGADYKDRLANAGFHVKQDDYVKNFTREEMAKYGFSPQELIYYVTRK